MSTSVGISPPPILQFFNNAGQPNAGGSVLTQVGGVNYPTYQDSAGTIPLPNPIPLNSRGEISNSAGQSCQLFLAAGVAYVFTQYDPNGNQINQAQYVGGLAATGNPNVQFSVADASAGAQQALSAKQLAAASGSTLVGTTLPVSGSATRTVEQSLADMVSALGFQGVDNTGTTDSTTGLNNAEALSTDLWLPSGTYKVTTKRNAALYWGPGVIEVNGFVQPTRRVGQGAAGENILPNTQWQVYTTTSPTQKYNAEGTGTMPALSISSYTTGAIVPTFAVSGSTGEVKDGDLLAFQSPADPNLLISYIRVQNLVANSSFEGQIPLGLKTSGSVACTAIPMMIGDMTGSTTLGPDGWSKTQTLNCWRDDQPANKVGALPYQVGLKKAASSAESFYRALDTMEVASIAGKTLAFGCSVLHKINSATTGYWQPFISFNGTGGATVYGIKSTGTVGAVEWGEIYAQIPSDATSVSCGVSFNGAVGDVAYVGECMGLPNVQYIGASNYAPPVREILIPVVKFSPLSWVGASVTFPSSGDGYGTYSFGFQVDAETNGAIMPTVRKLQFQIEGVNSQTVITGSSPRVMAFRDVLAPPIKYAVIMGQQVANLKTFANGEWTLNPGGQSNGIVYDEVASDPWFDVSMDISGVTLN